MEKMLDERYKIDVLADAARRWMKRHEGEGHHE